MTCRSCAKLILVMFMFAAAVLNGGINEKKADMVFVNGRVLTMDSPERCTAIAIKNSRFLCVGSRKDVEKYIKRKTEIIDLKGQTVVPGLHDAHLHFESGSAMLSSKLSLRFMNLKQIQKKIAEVKNLSPPGALIKAYHFNQVYFSHKKWPSRYDLDGVAPDNPVVIYRVDGHTAWVNSKALAMLEINRNTPDPQGGKIQRLKNMVPTGILFENAADMASRLSGAKMVLAKEASDDPLTEGIRHANRLGLCSVTTSGSLEFIEKLKSLESRGKLTLRFFVWLPAEKINDYISKGILPGEGSELVKTAFLKIYADGTIGSATAAMFDPYLKDKSSRGILIHPTEELDTIIEKAQNSGWPVGVHAIGNRAVCLVLNAIEKAQKKSGSNNIRHRIEHSQFVRTRDIFRYKRLNVVSSMQTTHCTSDLLVVEDRVGHEVAAQGYRWKSFLQSGTALALGTDWPIEPLDPRRGLYSAIARKNIETDRPENGWFKEEAINILQALNGYSAGAAYAVGQEKRLGKIKKGMLADLTVFQEDIEKTAQHSPRKLLDSTVTMTVLAGKIVYRK